MYYFCQDVIIDPNKGYEIGDTMGISIVLEPRKLQVLEAKIVDIKTMDNISKMYFEYTIPETGEIAKSIYIIPFVEDLM